MVKLATLDVLARLEREMAAANRSEEEAALREALTALARPEQGFLTTGQAAEQLSVSIPTVKRWIERGALKGGEMGGRWFVTKDSVDWILDVRRISAEMDAEGNPTQEDILRLRKQFRQRGSSEQVA